MHIHTHTCTSIYVRLLKTHTGIHVHTCTHTHGSAYKQLLTSICLHTQRHTIYTHSYTGTQALTSGRHTSVFTHRHGHCTHTHTHARTHTHSSIHTCTYALVHIIAHKLYAPARGLADTN